MVSYFFELTAVTGGLLALALSIAWGLTRLAIVLAEKRRIMAEVNHRSSHRTPTPRLGGVGLVAGILLGIGVATLAVLSPQSFPVVVRPTENALSPSMFGVMAACVLGAFLLGLWDDISNPPAWVKLVGQLILAIAPPLLGWRMKHFHVPGMDEVTEIPAMAGTVVTALWILALMNAVNFMDGINGIAGRFGQIVAGATFFAIFQLRGGEGVMVLCACLFGACTGFLFWNHPKARTFMGDCGSQPLGLFVALLGVMVVNLPTSYPLPFLGFVIIVSPFLFDVGITLMKRLLEGQNVLKAHREHLYQRHLAATGEDHDNTLFFYELHHLPIAVIGILYIFYLYAPANAAAQTVCLLLTTAILAHYAWRVLRAEDQRLLAPTG
ncbi:hypothetical protein GC173_05730 [bacterium]|nr:hypothetical protein [bacterium]